MNPRRIIFAGVAFAALASLVYFQSRRIKTIDQETGGAEQAGSGSESQMAFMEGAGAPPAKGSTPELISAAEKSLPKIKDAQEMLDEDMHDTQSVAEDPAITLGSLEDRADRDPASRQAIMEFYQRCAKDEAVMDSIRAVCLRSYSRLWKVLQPNREIDLDGIDPSIIELAELISAKN